ncbi:hypothetical protein A7A08_02438 [Methyloligella halotolerans]|uniref:Lipoprotein n=1 Tax=Methyloligella halotolerans TaxID=1177755 RepID=A0A1E2RX17_9HYPH|nr:hypothetical protein [Methyloligella halotolerans]ODA66670.1 hypothetical protein A7A08_02438 [Methyloligella halotolerans]
MRATAQLGRGVRLAATWTMLCAMLPLLGACGDEVSAPKQAEEIPTDSTQSKTLAKTGWLTVHDKISPAQWLASREAGHDVELEDPRVKALHKKLQDAKSVFGTPYRMTANRAVQLEEMIDKEGWEHEDAAELITTFTEIGVSKTSGEGFGQLAQAYFQLRKQGLSRDEALQYIQDEAKETSGQ